MKYVSRILILLIVFTMGVLSPPPGTALAKSNKLTPGIYMGRFQYSAYAIMVDDQKVDDITTHVDHVANVYIQGTIIIQVDKNGKINPGIKIIPDTVQTYMINTMRVNKIACSVTGYIEGETKIKMKPTSVSNDSQAPSFSADISLSNINTLNHKKSGDDADCPSFATKKGMESGSTDQINALNKYKVMKFTIVRNSEGQFSGNIIIPGYQKKLSTPGGYILEKDTDGFFNVHLNDPLAPVTDDSTAPLVGEWRTK
jgi:hypothetical protein